MYRGLTPIEAKRQASKPRRYNNQSQSSWFDGNKLSGKLKFQGAVQPTNH